MRLLECVRGVTEGHDVFARLDRNLLFTKDPALDEIVQVAVDVDDVARGMAAAWGTKAFILQSGFDALGRLDAMGAFD